MKKNSLLRFASLAAMGFALAACDLAIDNPTNGDTRRVLGTPDDAEALISTYYKRWSSGLYGSTTDLEGMANVMSLMNYSSLANNCQNNHLPFAGSSNGNAPGNVCAGEQVRLYQFMNEVARVSSQFLQQMDSGLVLGQTTPAATDARNLRARAWSEFLRGLSLGYLAMVHDSSSIVSPNMPQTEPACNREALSGQCTGILYGYQQVMDSAYVALDRAMAYAATTPNPSSPGGFPIPDSWLPSPTSWTVTEFTRLIRTYKARFRANVARTPAEAIDWAAVVADAQNGITADHYVTTSTTTGPANAWRQQYNSYTTWHQMPPFIIGMADQSGSYAAWISQPLTDRGAGNNGFFMVTADKRFPQGTTRALQQSDFNATATSSQCDPGATACKRYFVNRPAANDQFSGVGWGWSNYDFARFRSWNRNGDATSARNGKTLFFTKAEIDLLQAEGLYRLGPANDAAVAALVNRTRVGQDGDCDDLTASGGANGPDVANNGIGDHPMFGTKCVAVGGGLPAVLALRTGAATGVSPACIPKIPTAAQGPVVCGDLFEALKYEKRIETAYTSFAPWFFDSRRWGDLPKDTPLFWPVPFQDLQARGRPVSALYGTGLGSGNAPNSTAAGSAYGW